MTMQENLDNLSYLLDDIWDSAKEAPSSALEDTLDTLSNIVVDADRARRILVQVREEMS